MPNSSPSLAICAALTCALAVPPCVSAQSLTTGTSPAPRTAQSEWRETTSFHNLFAQTTDDFRRVVSKDSAVILAIGGVAAAVGHSSDRQLSTAMSSGSRGMEAVFGPGELVGGAHFQAAGAVATYTIGRVTSNATVARIGADLIRAQIVTQTLTAAVKTAVGRTRPDGTQYSFPSGHSAVTFASATVLQRHLGWRAGIPAYAVASYVAASRIEAKRHFLSDVAFGAALGIAAGRSVTIGSGNHRFALAPSAVPGGGGLSLTWIDRK